VREPLLQAFPFPSTGGGDTAPTFSGLRVYLQFMWEVGLPPSPVEFSSTATFTSFPAPGCWVVLLLLPSPARLVLRDSSAPPFSPQGAPPSLLCVFFFVVAYYSVFFSFFPGWGSVCPGGYADLAQGCLWEYCVPLSSPCGLRLPKPSGRWCLAAVRGLSWFLRLT
jgi:hypothetical protein